MKNDQVLELLSPCKTADIGIEAINHGADAVYIGGPLFSARASAGNSMQEIERLTKYAHRFNAGVYLALNTILKDSELDEAAKLAWQAYETGVDALIVQDFGLLMQNLPPIQLHASTQCDIRTPEKAKFLESVGFSQIVPARELTLDQIKAIYDTLDSCRIEFFIHGALCVSYSGQCYASQALKGRSANRGQCAQICRLPFDVYDLDGNELLRQKHVLSLKDNNQSDNLSELIAAGVRSFKIEGRYKDLTYVKNTTAFYRRLIDKFISEHSQFQAESDGRTSYTFEPNLEQGFNRGSTDYFVNGRSANMAEFDSPKNVGKTVGTITKIEPHAIVIKSKESFNNGDGLTYFDEAEELRGFLVNRAEQLDSGLTKLHLHTPTSKMTDLKVGTTLMRNRDAAWLKKMNAETALRKIPIKIEAFVDDKSIKLAATDPAGNKAEVTQNGTFDEAKDPVKALEQLAKSLNKLGQTDFEGAETQIHSPVARFLPVSQVNELRRKLVDKLESTRAKNHRAPAKAPVDETVQFPAQNFDYRANVYNEAAKAFYKMHGIEVSEKAFESGETKSDIELMRCRYCIRSALNICPKQAKQRGEKIKPEDLILKYKDVSLVAKFHCKPCEMSIHKGSAN